MITKEKFVQYINYIQFLVNLVDEDQKQPHIKSILKHIQKTFPVDENGHCEVTHYCFELNFGKPNIEGTYESPQELYDRLIKEINIKQNDQHTKFTKNSLC